jgi:hypothetical protein
MTPVLSRPITATTVASRRASTSTALVRVDPRPELPQPGMGRSSCTLRPWPALGRSHRAPDPAVDRPTGSAALGRSPGRPATAQATTLATLRRSSNRPAENRVICPPSAILSARGSPNERVEFAATSIVGLHCSVCGPCPTTPPRRQSDPPKNPAWEWFAYLVAPPRRKERPRRACAALPSGHASTFSPAAKATSGAPPTFAPPGSPAPHSITWAIAPPRAGTAEIGVWAMRVIPTPVAV